MPNIVQGDNAVFATISGGVNNSINGAKVLYAFIGGGANNDIGGQASVIAGGYFNHAYGINSTIGGGYSNLASGDDSFVGGGNSNIALGHGATVGGGGFDGSTASGNQALGAASTIAGGWGNVVSTTATYAAVGGGRSNTASAPYATVGGGGNNQTSTQAATVGGGGSNVASGQNATIGGGFQNTAGGYIATVPGGYNNRADGGYSFAAGYNAKALYNGTFVWADSTGAVLSSTATDQFLVRASGGITMYTDSAATAGAAPYPGSTSWSVLSDRSLKANFAAVDDLQVLDALASVPIQTWNYQSQAAGIRHIGQMAQDFAAAFHVGENDTTISTVDAQVVALAAIQGLYGVVKNQETQLNQRRADKNAQQAQIDDLRTQLSVVQGPSSITNYRI